MLTYQHVPFDTDVSIPSNMGKYKCLLLIERPVEDAFRQDVSRMLIKSGCIYAMAWGMGCSLWDDSVDYANIEEFSNGIIPDAQFVVTTWHEEDTLEEMLEYAKIVAVNSYANEPLHNLLVLDFIKENRAATIESAYNQIV